jgi:hypothetical protein
MSFVTGTSPAIAAAEMKGYLNKINDCLVFHPSPQMTSLAAQIVEAAIVGMPWSELSADFDSEVRRTARDGCGLSDKSTASSDFNALAEHQLQFRFFEAIDDALGRRAISPKGRPTFDSGAINKCLVEHTKPLHKLLVAATVYEKLSGNGDRPGYKALSAHLRLIAQHDCSLTAEQVTGPEFQVTIADYIYDGAFKILMPLLYSPR